MIRSKVGIVVLNVVLPSFHCQLLATLSVIAYDAAQMFYKKAAMTPAATAPKPSC